MASFIAATYVILAILLLRRQSRQRTRLNRALRTPNYRPAVKSQRRAA